VNRLIVTTSWDDGHKLDMKLAALLRKYSLPATFYISPRHNEFAPDELLSESQVQELAIDFEIGSHTITHPTLTRVRPDRVTQELRTSKAALEAVTGRSVTTFCYPKGAVNSRVAKQAQENGYAYARTIRRYSISTPTDLMLAATTLEAHRNPWTTFPVDLWRTAKVARFDPKLTVRCLDWENLAIYLFDQALAQGGVYHLWGHSWVIEKYEDWAKLERVFAYISGRNDIIYTPNSSLALSEVTA
jgi:hypothetical protein